MNVTHPQRIIDAHCHIGEIPPWKFYDLEHPVKPTVYDYRNTAEFVKNHMDDFKIERALAMSNYGVPSTRSPSTSTTWSWTRRRPTTASSPPSGSRSCRATPR
jgi:hypothetical protein